MFLGEIKCRDGYVLLTNISEIRLQDLYALNHSKILKFWNPFTLKYDLGDDVAINTSLVVPMMAPKLDVSGDPKCINGQWRHHEDTGLLPCHDIKSTSL